MDLRHLRSFLAVADELHFRRAALRIGITQPALSQQIAGLEADLGVKLFERSRRRVEITEVGRTLAGRLRHALGDLQDALEEARRAGSTHQRLRLGYVEYVNPPFLGALFRRMRERAPEVVVERRSLWTAEVISALASGTLDAGFVFLPVTHPALASRPVLEGHWVVIVPQRHRLASRDRVPLSALAGEPMILFDRSVNPPLFDAFVGHCASAGFAPRIVYATTQPSIGVDLVSQDVGVLVHASYVTRTLPEGLVARPLDGLETTLVLGAVWRGEDRSPALRKFLEALRVVVPRP